MDWLDMALITITPFGGNHMKKIFGIIWMVLVCCLLSSATCWADADVTIQEQVLMNENNICITATELKNTSTSYMLCLQVENNTDKKITVYAARTSIIGFTDKNIFTAT